MSFKSKKKLRIYMREWSRAHREEIYARAEARRREQGINPRNPRMSPEETRKRARERYRKLHPVPTRKCLQCGSDYKAERKLCCSDKCWKDRNRERARLAAQRARRIDPEPSREKQREWRRQNPKKMTERYKRAWAKTCKDPKLLEKKRRSDSRYYDKVRHPLRAHQCAMCSKQFMTRKSNRKYCSKLCLKKAMTIRARIRRQLGLDSYYKSERRKEWSKQYRAENREQFRSRDRENRKRQETKEYWEERLKKASNKGDGLWLKISRVELRKVRRLLKEGIPQRVSLSLKGESPLLSNSPP